jgi:hypothetical protein
MAKTLSELELIGRDGTSQAARRLPALDPGYVRVDERSPEYLLAAARELGRKLRYYGEDNQPAGHWSAFIGEDLDLAEVAAFLDDPERFPEDGPLRRPHLVLFLAFLGLFQHAQGQLDQLTRRHRDLYFRRVLRMRGKKAVPDRVHLLFDLARGIDQVRVAAGSRLSAGPDSLGKERLYATDQDLVVNRARVGQLRSVHVGVRRTGLADAREQYRTDQARAVRTMLEIALGDPRPGDPLPPYPGGGDAGELGFLTGHRDSLQSTQGDFCMASFELRELMKLKLRRDGADAEWDRINGYLEQAGKARDPGFVLAPADPRDFDANLAAAVGEVPSFDGLPDIESINQLYEQRNREDVKVFIHDQLYFEVLDDFVAMMQIKVRIDAEWAEINRLLETAGRRKSPSFSFDPSFDPTDFAANLDQAVGQTIDDLVQYIDDVECIEAYFFVPVEELIYLVGVVEKTEATHDEWRRADRILGKARREKVYAGRRHQLEEIHDPAGGLLRPPPPSLARDPAPPTPAPPGYGTPGFLAMVGHVLGEEVAEPADEAVARLQPYLSGESLAFIQEVAKNVTAEQDWQRVYRVLEIAWRNRQQLPEPVPEMVERLNLYPAPDASVLAVELGIEGELPRWRTFGMVTPGPEPPPPALGWAVSSPLLALAEGRRTITLTLGFRSGTIDGARLRELLAEKEPLRCELSTGDGWVEPETVIEDVPEDAAYKTYGEWTGLSGIDRANLDAVQITLRIGEEVAAIAAAPEDDPTRPASDWPVLRLMLRQLAEDDPESRADDLYAQLRQVHLAAVHIAVEVNGLSTVQLQNDESVLDPSKPFEPFGISPAVGSRLLLGHPELVTKRIDSLSFQLEWMGRPENLAEHYRNYGFTDSQGNVVDPGFNARISLVDRRVEILLQEGAPLFSASQASHAIAIDPPRPEDSSAPADHLYDQAPVTSFGEDLLEWDRYLRWQLNAPDFQHQVYPGLAAEKAIALAIAIAGPSPPTEASAPAYKVNPPYTPKLQSLQVDYTSSLEIVLDDTSAVEAGAQVLFIHPFGIGGVEPERSPQGVPLLPRYDNEGELYIGLRDLDPPQRVTLLFQLAEGSADPDLEPGRVSWSSLDGDSWHSLDDGRVLGDATRGLISSGIVELDLPAVAPSTLLPGDLYWLRAAVTRNAAAVCDTIAIHTQAVSATFVDQDNAADHFSQPLPEETLSQLVKPRPEIAGVRQPYTSWGGRMAEAEESFAVRVSERLRHKQRALTMWDYERLVLERFPEVYKAKCLPANLDDPGRVVVVVIPDVRHRFPFDPFEPKAPANLLAEIEEYLTAAAPAVASIAVRNPHYVAVKVRFSVRFSSRGNEGYYRQVLNDELNRFLSPWAYEEGADIAIGGRIYANSIIDFLDRRPYVDYVADLKLFASDDGEHFLPVTAAGEGGYAVTCERGDGVLVAARKHEIDLIPEAGYEEVLARGINYMRIELDFIVA